MSQNKIFLMLALLLTILISGCANSRYKEYKELEHFLKISPEQMEKQRALAETLLRNEVCPKIQNKEEKDVCSNLKVKTSMTVVGFAFVKKEYCGVVIYIEPLSIIFTESSLKTAMAHEVGHTILQKCDPGPPSNEVEADLYAARIFGKNSVIKLIEQLPQIHKTPLFIQSIEIKNEYRKRILALSGW